MADLKIMILIFYHLGSTIGSRFALDLSATETLARLAGLPLFGANCQLGLSPFPEDRPINIMFQ